jgi:hypothetical protein
VWAKDAIIRKPNIVAVYDTLSTAKISIDELRAIFPSQEPAIQSMPGEVIALLFPETERLNCIIGNRRVTVAKDDISNTDVFIRLAHEANRIVKKQHALVAYGFNYEFVHETEDALGLIRERFLREPETIEESLGKLVQTEITIAVQRENEKIQFTFRPVEDSIVVRTNVHFDSSDLPNHVKLKRLFLGWADTARNLLDSFVRM